MSRAIHCETFAGTGRALASQRSPVKVLAFIAPMAILAALEFPGNGGQIYSKLFGNPCKRNTCFFRTSIRSRIS
jgi:hypothetical protein